MHVETVILVINQTPLLRNMNFEETEFVELFQKTCTQELHCAGYCLSSTTTVALLVSASHLDAGIWWECLGDVTSRGRGREVWPTDITSGAPP